MEQPSPSPIDDLSLDALRSLVKELVGKLAAQDAQIKALKEEVTRLKGHKGKPKLKPSGMEQATEKRSRRRGKKKGSRPSRQNTWWSTKSRCSRSRRRPARVSKAIKTSSSRNSGSRPG